MATQKEKLGEAADAVDAQPAPRGIFVPVEELDSGDYNIDYNVMGGVRVTEVPVLLRKAAKLAEARLGVD